MLIDGTWDPEGTIERDEEGNFVRQETTFRARVSADPNGIHPVESGRYHLYVSYACPWAHRTLIGRSLLNLESHISVDVVTPIRYNDGWEFDPTTPGATPDTVNDADYLREVYLEADSTYTGRVTVPVLWDKEQETIVNNESIDILEQLDLVFGKSFDSSITLFPEGRRDEIWAVIDAIYEPINNGVYRTGFASTQQAYEMAVNELFEALDKWDSVLADQRYLVGDVFTAADVCLLTTLIRFDPVYHVHFKCSRHRISDYTNLHAYLSELIQRPDIAETVEMDHIRQHYYRSHDSINPRRIVAVPPAEGYVDPSERQHLPGRFATRGV